MDWVHIARFTTPVKDIPYEKFVAVDAVKSIFSDYGGYLPYEKSLYQIGGKPISHAVIGSQLNAAEFGKMQTPAFVHVFVYNWGYPNYSALEAFMNTLPKNVVWVRPDEMMRLYEQSQGTKK